MISKVFQLIILGICWIHASTYHTAWTQVSRRSKLTANLPLHSCRKHANHPIPSKQLIVTPVWLQRLQRSCKQVLSVSLAAGMIFSGSGSAVQAKDFPVFSEVWSIVNSNFFDSTYNQHDWEEVRTQYLAALEHGDKDETKAIKDMLALLGDKYSRLVDKATYESLWKFDAIGVGLLFQSDANNRMYVSAPPLKGSSGAKAGVSEGDVVYAINGQSTTSLTAMQLLDQMSNDDKDTMTLDIANSKESEISRRTVILKREKVEVANPVSFEVQTLSNKKRLGYIRMKEFNAKSVPGMLEALNYINTQNVDEIVLDLRGNTGGGFQFALNIGGMFMQDKVMVSASGKGMPNSIFKSSYPDGVLTDKPLFIVTDALSASASEVLTAGLHDNCRAAVIGSKTFGKGKIQAVFGLKDGEGLTLTVAQYLSPRGDVIQLKGIEPDLPVSTTNAYANYFLDTFSAGKANFGIDFNKVDLDLAQKKMQDQCTP